MADLISKDIVDLQDIEKVQYLQTLQADPAKYSAFVQQKTGRILSEVTDSKRAAFMKSSGDMARMMDMNANSLAALYRTQDLLETEDHILSEQERMKATAESNMDLTRRQVEINNWYYENKRESLFVLQLVLLTLLTVTVLLYLASTGWIGHDGANYLMLIVILIGAGTWIYRWYYTGRIRDPRYWNRRYFPQDGKVAPAADNCPPAGGAPNLGPGGTPPILGPGGTPPPVLEPFSGYNDVDLASVVVCYNPFSRGQGPAPLGPGGEERPRYGPGGEERPRYGPGGEQRHPLGPGGQEHPRRIGPGGEERPHLGPGGQEHPRRIGPGGEERHSLGPGGQEHPRHLGPGGEKRHLIGPGGEIQPCGRFCPGGVE